MAAALALDLFYHLCHQGSLSFILRSHQQSYWRKGFAAVNESRGDEYTVGGQGRAVTEASHALQPSFEQTVALPVNLSIVTFRGWRGE